MPRIATHTRFTRRQALLGGAAGIAALYSFDRLGLRLRPSGRPTAARAAELSGPFAPFEVDLPILPVLDPVERTDDGERYELAIRDGVAEILPGFETPITGYDGRFPGPTIRARQGRRAEVRVASEVSAETSVHLHGGLVTEESDGALHAYHIHPGMTRTYDYPNDQPAATMWYHDHVHGLTGPHLNAGLTAFYIVDPDYDDEDDPLPRGERDVALMIQDRSFNDDGSFVYARNLGAGFHGDTILVNGAVAPRMRVSRSLYRLRLLNASNARIYSLVLGNGRPMYQIAGDAGLLPRPVLRRAIPLAPAERVEVLVDFCGCKPGSEIVLHNEFGEASTTAVMRFDVDGGTEPERARIPRRLADRPGSAPPAAERTLRLDLATSPELEWQINGQGFDEHRIDAEPQLGTTELWTFVNESEHPHPMHLHGCHFRVASVNGEEPHQGDRGWKDTVNVPAHGTAEVIAAFEKFPGRFVFHCHTAEHSDQSMMGLMEIVG